MYQNETFEVILQRMLDRIADSRDKREGSIIWDADSSAAIELQLVYLALEDILNESFGDTASREFLIRRAKERGITPYPATNAILEGHFTPSDVSIIGRRFSMPNTSLTYLVTEHMQGGAYQVKCERAGNEGNQFLGAIIPIGGSVSGLQSSELVGILVPAQDEEDTEILRQRYFDSFDEKAFGGNIRDYQVKVKSIEGVGALKVTPIWQGGGTVLLTVLDTLLNPATDILIENVQTIIDPTQDGMGIGLAPIGHTVTVQTANIVPLHIEAVITFANGYTWELVQQQIIEMIENYLLELRKDWENQDILTPLGLFQNPLIVRVSQIESRILTVQGVVDITDTTINGEPRTLAIEKYSVPVFGGITHE